MTFSKMIPVMMTVVSMGLFGPALAEAHDKHRTQDRLEGRSYDKMRELAHALDKKARHAADQAIENAHHGDRRERRFVDAVTHFARQTGDFHERMDRYRESPWDVPDEIDHLIKDARRVSSEIRKAHVFEHTWDDWDEVVDVLVQMQRVPAREHD